MNIGKAPPLAVLRQELEHHRRDAAAAGGIDWLAQALDLMTGSIANVPPPEREIEAIPDYVYPH